MLSSSDLAARPWRGQRAPTTVNPKAGLQLIGRGLFWVEVQRGSSIRIKGGLQARGTEWRRAAGARQVMAKAERQTRNPRRGRGLHKKLTGIDGSAVERTPRWLH